MKESSLSHGEVSILCNHILLDFHTVKCYSSKKHCAFYSKINFTSNTN